MIKFKKTYLAALMALFCLITTMDASAYCQGQWVYSVHGGVSPARFNTPFGLRGILTNGATPNPAIVTPNTKIHLPSDTFNPQNYNSLYRTPYIFGFDVGYMATKDLEVFFGYEYLHAKGKKYTAIDTNFNNSQYLIKAQLKDYDAHIGHVGVRYYFDIGYCHFAPFIGAKVGGSQNKQGTTNLTIDTGQHFNGFTHINTPGFFNTIGFIGGPQIGFDYRITDRYTFYIGAEALYKTSHYADTRPYHFDGPNRVTSLQTQVVQFGTNLWAFPVMMGIRIIR